jgi:hypothetical protein
MFNLFSIMRKNYGIFLIIKAVSDKKRGYNLQSEAFKSKVIKLQTDKLFNLNYVIVCNISIILKLFTPLIT